MFELCYTSVHECGVVNRFHLIQSLRLQFSAAVQGGEEVIGTLSVNRSQKTSKGDWQFKEEEVRSDRTLRVDRQAEPRLRRLVCLNHQTLLHKTALLPGLGPQLPVVARPGPGRPRIPG